MPWLPIYLIREDIPLLNQLLNQEPELAFLVENGSGKWIAKAIHDVVDDLQDRHHKSYSLWHVPSGPLPLIEPITDPTRGVPLGLIKDTPTIPDPWKGWDQLRTGTPYFGVGESTGVLSLEIELLQRDFIPISSFGWIGNHYREIGYPAHPATDAFWQKLRRIIKKHTVHIPRANNQAFKKEIYAFPKAYKAIQSGHACQM